MLHLSGRLLLDRATLVVAKSRLALRTVSQAALLARGLQAAILLAAVVALLARRALVDGAVRVRLRVHLLLLSIKERRGHFKFD